MTKPIKAKIQELCPDVMEDQSIFKAVGGTLIKQETPITLAVVLRATTKVNSSWTWSGKIHNLVVLWNLEEDNYDQQSEETKAFIESLLGL